MSDIEQLSPHWRYSVVATFIFSFTVLMLLTVKAYLNASPIPRSRPRYFRFGRLHRR
jgi:hypothetical protein